jgi:hypothetical protein
MTKKYFSLSIVLAACLTAPVLHAAESDKVVGVSRDEHKGDKNPAKRHQACDDTFKGSHWCSTQEYLDGGMAMDADTDLDTAWIRPTIISAVYNTKDGVIYNVDVSGGAVTWQQLNCQQWSSKASDNSGPALQTNDGNKDQIFVLKQCSKELPSLCCAPVADN